MMSGNSSSGFGQINQNKDYNINHNLINKYSKHLQKIDSKLFNPKGGL